MSENTINLDIIKQLTAVEIKVLPELNKTSSLAEVMKNASLKDVEVLRAAQWLSNKELVTLKKEESELIDLDVNGIEYKEKGFPEKQEEVKKLQMELSQLIQDVNTSLSTRNMDLNSPIPYLNT